jgi:hypothetical protein
VEARIGAGGGGVVRAAYSAMTSGAGLGYMSSWSGGVFGALASMPPPPPPLGHSSWSSGVRGVLASAAGLGVSRDRARVNRGWGGGV